MRGLAACSVALLLLLLLLGPGHASARALSEEAAVKAVVAKAAYKTTRPLIGILTQPCHDCPGR
jgi:gamma-glutamyl hydrolase